MYKKTVTLVILLLVLLAIIFLIYRGVRSYFASSPTIDTSSASVIKEIRSLNRLETASFTLDKVIEAGSTGNFFSNILFGDRILLIAHGTVVAGIDLSKLSEKDIVKNDTTLTINLPPPTILSTTLDDSQTKVYDRKEGLLVNDTGLESKARAQAQTAIQSDACAGNILDVASTNARAQLKALFGAAGFSEVDVYIPEGSCK